MQALRPTGRTIYFFGALGGLLFGYDTGVISGALLFIPNAFKLTPFVKGAVVAGLLLGAMIGAAFAGRLSDRIDWHYRTSRCTYWYRRLPGIARGKCLLLRLQCRVELRRVELLAGAAGK